jgi:hypothetical protein
MVERRRAMAQKIRNAGYVALVGGVLMILATYAGVVALDGFDVLEAKQRLYNVRTYVALAPGMIITALGLLMVKYQGKG